MRAHRREAVRRAKRTRLRFALFVGVAVFLASSIVDVGFFEVASASRAYFELTIKGLESGAVVGGVALLIAGFFFFTTPARPDFPDSLVCPACGRVVGKSQARAEGFRCPCGGHPEWLEGFRWVPDDGPGGKAEAAEDQAPGLSP